MQLRIVLSEETQTQNGIWTGLYLIEEKERLARLHYLAG